MVSSLCPFCQYSNSALAKFCNDCGSPLTLKPCNQCGAINDRAAKNCHECRAELTARPQTPEPELVSSSVETADFLSSLHRVDFETAPMPFQGSAPDTVGLFAGRLAAGAELGAGEDQPADAHVVDGPSALESSTHLVHRPELAPASAEHRWPRAALIAGFIALIAVSGYYLNRDQARHNLATSEPDPGAPATAALGPPPSSPPPTKIEVPPNSSQTPGSASPDAVGVTNKALAPPEASAQSTNDVKAVSGDGANTATPQPQRVNKDTPPRASDPHSDPAQPSTQSTSAAEAAHETGQSTSQVDAASRPPTARLTAPSSASSALLHQQGTDAASDAPRVSVCTDAVAALGFCNLKNNQPGND